MKAMALQDLLVLKGALRRHALIWTPLLLAVLVLFSNSPVPIMYLAFLEAMMAVHELLQGEGRHAREGAREGKAPRPTPPAACAQAVAGRDDVRAGAGSPPTHAQEVAGRYASLGIVVLAFVALGACLYLAACAIAFALPASLAVPARPLPFDASSLALSMGAGTALGLLVLGVQLPLYARYGFGGAVRLAGVAAMLFALVLLGALGTPGAGLLANGSWAVSGTFAQCLLLAAGMAAAGCAFYAASATVAAQVHGRDGS